MRSTRSLAAIAVLASSLAAGLVSTASASPAPTRRAVATAQAKRAAATGDKAACAKVEAAYPSYVGKTYTVGNSPTIPGYETISKSNPNKIVGFDPSFLAAVNSCLGVKTTFSQMAFDALIPALQAGRVDLVISNLIASRARAKQVRFDLYQKDVEALIVAKGNPKSITSTADLCGNSIAVFPGTLQQGFAEAQAATCKSEGKGTVNVETYQDFNGCVQAVITGRADTTIDPVSVADAAVAQFPGKLSATKPIPQFQSNIGIAFPLASTGLAKAYLAAIAAVQNAGIEKRLLAKWNQDPNTQAVATALP